MITQFTIIDSHPRAFLNIPRSINTAIAGKVVGLAHGKLVDPQDPDIQLVGVLVVVYISNYIGGRSIFTNGEWYMRIAMDEAELHINNIRELTLGIEDAKIIKKSISCKLDDFV